MFKNYIKPALTLTIITVIVAIALSVTYSFTSQKLNANNPQTSSGVAYLTSGTDTYKKVLPEANFFIMVSSANLGSKEGVSATVKGESQKGVAAGYVITTNGKGYSPVPIQVAVGIGVDGKIRGIEILSMRETPGIGDRVNSGSFLNKYVGMTNNDVVNKTMPDRADIITGATYSSRGVFSAVKAALGQYAILAGGAK